MKTNLFNDPAINEIKNSLPPETLEEYRLKGESMYKDIDFEKCAVTNMPPFFSDHLIYLEELIKSGLHISMLDEDDIILLKEIHGEKLYERYDYVKEDLTEIFTIKKE